MALGVEWIIGQWVAEHSSVGFVGKWAGWGAWHCMAVGVGVDGRCLCQCLDSGLGTPLLLPPYTPPSPHPPLPLPSPPFSSFVRKLPCLVIAFHCNEALISSRASLNGLFHTPHTHHTPPSPLTEPV